MDDVQVSEAAIGTGDRSRRRAALPALCATQITSWGIVYYAFPVLNPRIVADTGWSATATTGAFSAALIVSALAGIPVGRILDHRGPRTVMTTGSVVGGVRLSHGWCPFPGRLVGSLGQCFACATGQFGGARHPATLVDGEGGTKRADRFASTVAGLGGKAVAQVGIGEGVDAPVLFRIPADQGVSMLLLSADVIG